MGGSSLIYVTPVYFPCEVECIMRHIFCHTALFWLFSDWIITNVGKDKEGKMDLKRQWTSNTYEINFLPSTHCNRSQSVTEEKIIF